MEPEFTSVTSSTASSSSASTGASTPPPPLTSSPVPCSPLQQSLRALGWLSVSVRRSKRVPNQFSSRGTGNPWILHLKRCAGQFKMTLSEAMKSPKIRAMYTTRALVKIRPNKKKAKVAAHSNAEKPLPPQTTAPIASCEPVSTNPTPVPPPANAADAEKKHASSTTNSNDVKSASTKSESSPAVPNAMDLSLGSSPASTDASSKPPAKPVPVYSPNDSFDVKYINDEKQWGLFAKRPIEDGEYIGEYTGQRINGRKAITHAQWRSEYVFALRDDKAIDAEHADCVCKYVNHSRFHPNIEPKRENRNSEIHFYATRNIDTGEELLYDYGDRSADSLKRCPWLAE